MFVKENDVKNFFEKINNSGIEYVLIKNINNELPAYLEDGKDLDILVKIDYFDRYNTLMKEEGYSLIQHPQSRKAGWNFIYGATECIKHKKKDSLEVDTHCELCVASLIKKTWIPLDKVINNSVWENKVWDEVKQWWILDDKTMLVYLIARCIFDKKEINELYINEIEKRKYLLQQSDVINMLKVIFFKYTDTLCYLINKHRYDEIIKSYISYSDY